MKIEKIHTSIAEKQRESGALEEKEKSYYKVEFESLEFLFKVILHKSIQAREANKWKETGEKDYYGTAKKVYVESGDLDLHTWECDINEVNRFISTFTNSSRTIPKNWRKIIYTTLSKPLPKISGWIQNPAKNQNSGKFEGQAKIDRDLFFVEKSETLTPTDTSAFLALKIAAHLNQSIKTECNHIVIVLSGGLSAKISFREKGKIISKKQKLEIYENYLNFKMKIVDGEVSNLSEFIYETLYYQSGYANSTVKVMTPGAFYIIEENYIIEIQFNAAPILFDSNIVAKFAPNISGVGSSQT